MKTRIFLVDDHAMVRQGLAAMIGKEHGWEVCGEAADASTATSEISRLRPDLVIVDISLPGASGIELVKNIQAIDPAIRFVVLSAHDESVYALRALKAGAKGYVMKQDKADAVIAAVRKVIKGQIYVSEQVNGEVLNRMIRGQDGPDDSPVAGLSDRELEVATLIGSGLGTREIGARLRVSVKTVETHRARLKTKLSLNTAMQLVQFCVRWVDAGRQP